MYQTGWNEVRERILNYELRHVKEMLGIANDDNFEFMKGFQLFTEDIQAMEDDVETYGDSFKNYDTFKRDLFDFLVGLELSKMPYAESSSITLAWLKILKLRHNIAD